MIEYRQTVGGDEVTIYVYEPGDDVSRVRSFVGRTRVVGFDTESSDLDVYSASWFTRLAQFGDSREAHVLRYDSHRHEIAALIRQANALAVHNGDHDLHVVNKAYGVPLTETCPKIIDTLTLSRLFDPKGFTQLKPGGKVLPTHALKDRARMLIDGTLDIDKALSARFKQLKLTIKNGAYGKIPIDDEVYVRYAGVDPILAHRLLGILATLGTPELWSLYDYERRLSFVLATMHARGMKLDPEYTERQSNYLRGEAAKLREMSEALGWPVQNIATKVSKETLDAYLSEHGIDSPRTKKGGLSFAKDALTAKLAGTKLEEQHSLFVHALEYEKFCKDYMDKFAVIASRGDRLHPVIDSMGAQTARMSASNPPVQQLPRTGDVRGCAVADDGMTLISADLAQVEFCVGAGLSGDPRMSEAIKRGIDLHDMGARVMFGDDFTKEQRNVNKRAGFGRLYGAGKFTVASQCGVAVEVAEAALNNFDRMFPRIKQYGKELATDTTDFLVTPYGRKIAPDPLRPWGYINYMVQSSARDVFVHGVFRMVDAGLLDYLWLFVHDEAILNVPKEDAEEISRMLVKLMSDEFMGIPIRADGGIMGERWVKN